MKMIWLGIFAYSAVGIALLSCWEWQNSLAFFGLALYLFGIAMLLRSEGYHAEDEQAQTEPEPEFSLVKVREEKTRDTIYELENGQVVTHRKGLFDDSDSFKVAKQLSKKDNQNG